MVALGYTTTRMPITVGARPLGERDRGSARYRLGTRGLVVVTAHLDSINQSRRGAGRAPGADDNGSGSAGTALGRRAGRRTRRARPALILFGGEEQGLFGSRLYVAELPRRAVADPCGRNMDMIGT